ncbi:MAG: SCO family protein [Rhodospirillales bacterium]|nr:SCO family protein [Rhodospirillales bacterium]
MADEKRRIPVWIIVAALVVAALVGYGVFHYTRTDQVRVDLPAIGGPFSLIDQNGKTVTDEDFDDQFKLIHFGYTYSINLSATTLSTITEALELLGDEGERVAPLFITIDPERDSPEHLKMYLEHFHPRFVGLSGPQDAIAKTADRFQIHFARVENLGADAEDYEIDHTSIVYLMGPDGDFRAHFTDGARPEAIAERIREYL